MNAWGRVPLAKLAESVDYGVTASATSKPVGPKFLRITDIQDNAVNWETVPWCECDSRSLAESQLRPGDIVFARTGATTGKSYLIKDCPPETVFASYLIRVRVRENVEPRYVSHFFQTTDYWSQITRGSRGAAQPGVNATTLKTLEIPVPPLPEQRRIAAILDQADVLRVMRRVALADLDSLTQSIFIEMFGDPATNPKSWPYKSLIGLGNVVTGGTPPSSKPGMFEGPIPFVTPGDLESDESVKRSLTTEGAKESRTVRAGSTLVCCIGATIGKMGIARVQSAFNQQLNAVEWTGEIDDLYGYAALRFFKPTIRAWGASTTLPILKKSSFEKIEIPVPPVSLQREFAEKVKAAEKLRVAHKSSLAELDDLFVSLQNLAFKGGL